MEICVLKQLESDYFPKLYNIFYDNKNLYLQMEHAGNDTLKRHLSVTKGQYRVLFLILIFEVFIF
jgi:hypothetical protein